MSVVSNEEVELLGDSKYRAYISQVEKALRSFENTSEWADLISALGKLNKVLCSHVKFPVIPKRVTIGKRLAQCLHPALPSGVHLKALESYDIIFKCIGTTRLAADLFTYCSGLFPLLAYAAMNVKPMLLSLYEAHFVPLGKHIKPALTGLLLGLLPGLEEGSEHFDRTNLILESFSEATEQEFFYGCLWECVLSCSSVRLAAINFVLSHFNRKQTMEDQLYIMGTNIDLLIESLCVSVQDGSVLVQRSALELLMIGLPMHNSQLTRPDMIKITGAAIKVVLRRDMSLNRRLYAWLLGTDANGTPILQVPSDPTTPTAQTHQRRDSTSTITSETEMGYFNTYSREFLVLGVRSCIRESTQGDSLIEGKPATLRPFRVLISLLDKPEIGSVILEDVLIDVFRHMYHECEALTPDAVDGDASSLHKSPSIGNHGNLTKMGRRNREIVRLKRDEKTISTEIIKTANLLFGAFEPYFMWDFIARVFERICSHLRYNQRDSAPVDEVSVGELCSLVEFLLEKASLETYVETQTEHLPELLRRIMTSLCLHCDKLNESELTQALLLCSRILARVQPSMTPLGGSTDPESRGGSPRKNPAVGPVERDAGLKGPVEEDDENKSEITQLSEGEVYLSADSDNEQMHVESAEEAKEEPEADFETAIGAGVGDPETGSVFGEFLQYGDSQNENFPKWKLTPCKSPLKRPSDLLERTPQTLMQACVQAFQQLFCTIVTTHVLHDDEMVHVLMGQLHQPPLSPATTPAAQDRFSGGKESLWQALCGSDATQADVPLELRRIPLLHMTDDVCEAFASACQLLVDFSCFPMYCTDSQKVLTTSFKRGKDAFPEWLQMLITCSCFVENFTLQSAAISTMLDLVSLTQSVVTEAKNKAPAFQPFGLDDERRRSTEGTVSVVIIPSLSPQNLDYLNCHTNFYKIVGTHLWNYLDDFCPSYHQRSVDLLFQLHQLAPSPWICEDVIGNALLADDKTLRLEAHQKFAVLWHLLREKKQIGNPGIPVRTFDRSLFVMLDSLGSDTNPCRAMTQTWLTHAIQRGDIARILEPILLILLHPDTARISIQHVNIHQPRKLKINEDDDDKSNAETKIYAISSEGGNIIYHVSNQGRVFSKKTSEDLRTFALTTISEGGSGSATKAAKSQGEVENAYERVNPEELNLRVNPFGSQSSLDKMIFEGYVPPTQFPGIKNVKRLDVETCKKEGIYFDDEQGDDEPKQAEAGKAADQKQVTAEDICRSIVDSIVDQLLAKYEQASPVVLQDILDTKSESTENIAGLSQKKGRIPRSASRESSLGPDDYFSVIDGKVAEPDSQSETDIDASCSRTKKEEVPGIHPLHTHILLYTQKFDAQRTLYALNSLKSILTSSPRLVSCAMATSSLSNVITPHLSRFQNLLARHRRSVFGKNFFSEVPADTITSYRSSMYIEILISVCLYFVRSYYPNLMMSKLTELELNGNKEVQILSCEILTLLLSELVNIAKDSGKGFSTYIGDLFNRCKVQKALLHCMLASVYNARKKPSGQEDVHNITEAIISFNEENMDANTNETFQIKLLKLILVLIILEDQIRKAKQEPDALPPPEWEKNRFNYPTLATLKYVPSRPIVYQNMLLSAILSALKQQHLSHMHRHWIAMLTSALPYLGRALSHTVVAVVNQLCRNLELLAQQYETGHLHTNGPYKPERVPADHVIVLLEGMTTMCHYCLLDTAPQEISLGTPLPSGANNIVNDTASSGTILTNLIHVFNPYSNSREPSPAKEVTNLVPPVLEARRCLLSILPRILASLATTWKAINVSEAQRAASGKDPAAWKLGMPKPLRQYILEFVSPISLHHSINMLGAVAVVWNDRRQRGSASAKRVITMACDDQLLLVDLVSAIRVLPIDTLMQTVKQVIKQPPPTSQDKNRKRTPLEVSMLQFFYAYSRRTGGQALVDSWASLLALLRDGLQLGMPAPGQFLLLAILNEFVQRIPTFEERKDQKDLQDIAQKLLEACSEIAGSSLEQTTWLRRNLAVKPGPQVDIMETDDGGTDQEEHAEPQEKKFVESVAPDSENEYAELVSPELSTVSPLESRPSTENYRAYSVQALVMLAELTAGLLDVIYSSEEKDRVTPFLSSIMLHVFPYLRNHSPHNLPSFRASSQILASLSSYQYTRKAWRREAFELLLDASFFQMDEVCISYWRVIIDNLMTHDKTTFKDLLARVPVAPSGSLNLFSSRDQEFEQRAQLLKRLSFTIYCSETDQYQKHMPDIQERLADSLKMPSVPSVQAQVFLCFRVLCLRMSPQHLTSLWPTIITELIHVLLQIEQEVTPDVEESRTQLARMANLDTSWAIGNGLSAHNNPSWLHLYLAACKLLDMALVLPPDKLPQFQLYRWAFTGDPGPENNNNKRGKDKAATFTPHVARITRLMNRKFGDNIPPLVRAPGRPLLMVPHIRSIQDLHSFFNTISATAQSPDSFTTGRQHESVRSGFPKSQSMPEFRHYCSTDRGAGHAPLSTLAFVEQLVEGDFLEPMPRV